MQKFSAYAVEQRSGVEEYAPFKDIQDPHGRELKSWHLKMYFPGLEKSWILGKMFEVMEKSWNFIFWSKYFVLFEN